MEGEGWEIRPAGWILLIVLLVFLIYHIAERLRRPPEENQEKT